MAVRWYVIHVYSGFEKQVAEMIQTRAEKEGMAEMIEHVFVPTEEVVEVRRGQRVNAERKFFPGYVLIKMDLTDESWHLVKNTPKVTGFLGSGHRPSPLTNKEAERMMQQVEEGAGSIRNAITYEVGEQVRVREGAFASFNGVVTSVDEDKNRLTVEISIFGRATPVDLEFAQVEKQ